MRLPAAVAAMQPASVYAPNLENTLQCWITGCHTPVKGVDEDDLGLCDNCIEQLRWETNQGQMQELAS